MKQKMAGPAGFEPANAGTKTQCLTAWRRSNFLHFIIKFYFLKLIMLLILPLLCYNTNNLDEKFCHLLFQIVHLQGG